MKHQLSLTVLQKEMGAKGFKSLGNSGTFMMLDHRNADKVSMQGVILLNLHSGQA